MSERIRSAFLFVTTEVEFQEATPKGARVTATFMELNKPSGNNRMYRIEEGEQLAKSLVGKVIRFGANMAGKHFNKVKKIGFVESARKVGDKIKGVILIFDKNYIEQIKNSYIVYPPLIIHNNIGNSSIDKCGGH